MKDIFDEESLGSIRFKNRLVRSATWEGIAARDQYVGGMMRLCDDVLIPQYARLVELVRAQKQALSVYRFVCTTRGHRASAACAYSCDQATGIASAHGSQLGYTCSS